MADTLTDTEMFIAERNNFSTEIDAIDDVAVLRRIARKQFDLRQGAHALVRQTEMVDAARVQREASHAVSGALDWTSQSRRLSHAELQRRRGEAA